MRSLHETHLIVRIFYGIIAFCLCSVAEADDWPAYQHDNRRSAATAEKIDPTTLQVQWIRRSAHPPQKAWAGPAKWDAYAGLRGLKSMRNYDPVFHPIAVGDSVYFSSTVDDSVHCLNAETGEQRWSFCTDGPIRVAPSFSNGLLYFGSDDGFAYCIRAETGSLVWKYRPVEAGRKILNNGRFISLWPCRSGVLIEKNKAYFAASLFPWKNSYLCAVDATTGRPDAPGCFFRKFDKQTMEGPLAATSRLLIVPQGRVAPQLFSVSDGKGLGSLKGGGGSFVVISDRSQIFHGPGNKAGWITSSDSKTREKIATYKSGNAMVISGNTSYMLTDNSLSASDYVKRKILWTTSASHPYELILAGDTLIAGGRDEVAAFRAGDGQKIWTQKIEGKAFGLAVAHGRLFISTDEGIIYALQSHPGLKNLQFTKNEKNLISNEKTLKPIDSNTNEDLVNRWVFQKPSAHDSKVKDLASKQDAVILGEIRMSNIAGREALLLNGRSNKVIVNSSPDNAHLPASQLTVETWVRVDEPMTQGNIVGAFQGAKTKRGWQLGFRDHKFDFALRSEQGPSQVTHLTAKSDFIPGQWYHVVGSYNGTEMKIFVNGELENQTSSQKGKILYPPQVSYEMGVSHAGDKSSWTKGMLHEVSIYNRELSRSEIKRQFAANKFTTARRLQLAAGPWLQFTDVDCATIRWKTYKPVSTILEYHLAGDVRNITKDKLTTDHHVNITGLRREHVYTYTIKALINGKASVTGLYEMDTFFNYSLPKLVNRDSPFSNNNLQQRYAKVARHILSESGVSDGLCLVLGSEQGRLAYELAKRSNLQVIGVETDIDKVRSSREALKESRLYGSRIRVFHVDSLSKLPLTGHFANLIVSDSLLRSSRIPIDAKEMYRVLRPNYGVAYFGKPENVDLQFSEEQFGSWLKPAKIHYDYQESSQGHWVKIIRGPLAGSGQWSHLYGSADNSAFGGETLNGASSSDDLEVQWFGRPGPRFQPDRNGRKPSPLATGGRLFAQGLHRIVALDSYNGVVLWSLEIPELERFNMPRDSGNWCADEDFVYAAIRDRCWKIDAANGKITQMFEVIPSEEKAWKHQWGYLAGHHDLIIGSGVKSGTSWTNFWGGGSAGWYDAKEGEVTHKICSDNLFALSKNTGNSRWTYAGGVILNATITLGAERIYFVETRNPKVKGVDLRRIGLPELWKDQFLIALDAQNGEKIWESPIDTVDGKVVFYLAYGSEKLVFVSSADKQYHVYTHDALSGEPLWNTSFSWPQDHHGGHMSRPAIVADRLYVRPRVLDLNSGKFRAEQMPMGGCGTYAATTGALFFRASTVTMWDQKKGQTSRWDRLRPGCWLSTIPAGGMLLSPEAGGGCSCGSWMETSLGFIPKSAPALPQSTDTPPSINN